MLKTELPRAIRQENDKHDFSHFFWTGKASLSQMSSEQEEIGTGLVFFPDDRTGCACARGSRTLEPSYDVRADGQRFLAVSFALKKQPSPITVVVS